MNNCTKPHILVIESEDFPLMTMACLLMESGFRVSIAEHGREAMEVVSSRSLDLIFIDLDVPNMNGLEISRQLLSLLPTSQVTPIVAMIEPKNQCKMSDLRQHGVIGHIYKPVTKEGLQRAMAMVSPRLADYINLEQPKEAKK